MTVNEKWTEFTEYKSISGESCFLRFNKTGLRNVLYRCRRKLRHRNIKLRLYLENFQFSDFQQYWYDGTGVLNIILGFWLLIKISIESVSFILSFTIFLIIVFLCWLDQMYIFIEYLLYVNSVMILHKYSVIDVDVVKYLHPVFVGFYYFMIKTM